MLTKYNTAMGSGELTAPKLAEERRGMVLCMVDDLEKDLMMTQDNIQRLIMRLQPIISSVPEKVNEKQAYPSESFPLGNRIMELRRSVQSHNEILHALSQRVEV